MKRAIYIGISLFLFSVQILLPQKAQAENGQEVEQLKEELREIRAQFEQMKEAYDFKIEIMEAKIQNLEDQKTPEVVAAAPGESTPLPGLGRPAFEIPDISVVGNIIGNYGTDKSDPNRGKTYLEEVELAIQGYVYPDIWADFVIALDRESDGHYDVDLEEGYIDFQATPLPGLSAQVGRKLVGFGKVNPVHTHHWNYVTRPSVVESYLGDHGLVGQGANLSYLIPLPFFAQLDFGAWYVNGDDHGHHHNDLGLEGETYSTRLWSSFALTPDQELEIGLSGLRGYDADDQDRTHIGGLDLTYRSMGPGLQRFLSQTEFMLLNRDLSGGDITRWGFYQHLNYRFNKYWDAGIRFDWMETPFSEKDHESSVSGILTRSLTETMRLRTQYEYDIENSEHTVYLQAVVGLGPHAHPLE